jgi:hypothetical protein
VSFAFSNVRETLPPNFVETLMTRHEIAIVVLAVAVLAPGRTEAQAAPTDEHAPNGSIIGLTIGVPGYERQAQTDLVILGLDILHAKPSRVGVDFALGTLPRALSNRAVVLGGRLDAVVPIAVTRDFWLMPVAGGSMIGGASSDGGGDAFGGVNAGLGAILWSGRFGLRSSMTWHHFIDARGAVWLAEFGFVGGR